MANLFDLKGRVAVVTGASSGLGRSMAMALAKQGVDLVVLARRLDRLESLKSEVEQTTGVRCLPLQCDLAVEQDVINVAEVVLKHFGKIDILVNNAGKGNTHPLEDHPLEAWKAEFDVDMHGVFLCVREFGRCMLKNGYGRIINIASMYGLVGNMVIPSSAYHSAKGAVINFTRAIAGEWGSKGIVANCICPGYFPTEMTQATLDTPEFQEYMRRSVPVGRYGHIEELCALAIFLASTEAGYVNGAIIPIDGGYSAV